MPANHPIGVLLKEKERGFFRPFDKELRAAFWSAKDASRRTMVRTGTWAGIIVYVLFGVLDMLVVPDVAHLTIAGRLIAGGLVLVLTEALYRRGWGADAMDVASAAFLFVVFSVWITASSFATSQQMFASYILFGNIFMASATLFFAFRLMVSVTVSTALLAVMISSLVRANAFTDGQVIIYSSYFLSFFAFVFIVNLRMADERYRTFINERIAAFHRDAEEERGRELLRQSMTDYLTGVENRRSLDEGLEDYWRRSRDEGAAFALALIDVDHFKKFNDGHGHLPGDECLKRVARHLSVVVAERGGRLGRYGGEEFMAIAPIAGEPDALAFGEALRAGIEAARIEHGYRLDGTPIVTVSIGLGWSGARARQKVDTVIAEADQALYAAKAGGRNAVVLYDPRDPLHNDESEAVAAILKQALAEGLATMAYQPIVNMRTGAVTGYEALMRLRTPEGRSIPPSVFIPVAERTGSIVPLGRWAIMAACRDLVAPGIVPLVSVNVSAVQLKMHGFAMQVAAVLMETGVPGHRLALEITEGLQMEIDAGVLRTIGELKDLGVRIWLDDFGTGFAGLSRLRTIEFDMVKIDKSFLYAADDPRNERLLEDIITLVRRRGPAILLEGVETQAQLDFARASGVDEVQGYHLGRPAPIEAITARDGASPSGQAAKVVP